MKNLIFICLFLMAGSIAMGQSVSHTEQRFNNPGVPDKNDTLAFRFKGTQLLTSLIEYSRIYSTGSAYPIVVRNQAYQNARKLFSDSADFYVAEKGKQVKTDFKGFVEKLGTKKLNEKMEIRELTVLKTDGIGAVQGLGSGFSINATIALVKIKKQFGSEEEEVWEAVLSSASLKE